MADIIIREAIEKDISDILSLLYELGRPKPKNSDIDAFENLVRQYITDSDKQIFVAIDESKIVGMISMIFLPRLNHIAYETYIPELVVFKKYQNQGIGKKLINHCIAISKDKKYHGIRLESGNIRQESHKFYKHLGFEQSALSFTLNLE